MTDELQKSIDILFGMEVTSEYEAIARLEVVTTLEAYVKAVEKAKRYIDSNWYAPTMPEEIKELVEILNVAVMSQ